MRKLLILISLCCLPVFCASAQEVEANLIDAVTLYSNGQNKQARELLKTLSVAQPENDAVWYYLALSALKERKLEEAVEANSKAVAIDSTNYWYRRTQARLRVRRYQ